MKIINTMLDPSNVTIGVTKNGWLWFWAPAIRQWCILLKSEEEAIDEPNSHN